VNRNPFNIPQFKTSFSFSHRSGYANTFLPQNLFLARTGFHIVAAKDTGLWGC